MFTHELGVLSFSVAKYGVVGYGALQAFSIMRPTCLDVYVCPFGTLQSERKKHEVSELIVSYTVDVQYGLPVHGTLTTLFEQGCLHHACDHISYYYYKYIAETSGDQLRAPLSCLVARPKIAQLTAGT